MSQERTSASYQKSHSAVDLRHIYLCKKALRQTLLALDRIRVNTPLPNFLLNGAVRKPAGSAQNSHRPITISDMLLS